MGSYAAACCSRRNCCSDDVRVHVDRGGTTGGPRRPDYTIAWESPPRLPRSLFQRLGSALESRYAGGAGFSSNARGIIYSLWALLENSRAVDVYGGCAVVYLLYGEEVFVAGEVLLTGKKFKTFSHSQYFGGIFFFGVRAFFLRQAQVVLVLRFILLYKSIFPTNFRGRGRVLEHHRLTAHLQQS